MSCPGSNQFGVVVGKMPGGGSAVFPKRDWCRVCDRRVKVLSDGSAAKHERLTDPGARRRRIPGRPVKV